MIIYDRIKDGKVLNVVLSSGLDGSRGPRLGPWNSGPVSTVSCKVIGILWYKHFTIAQSYNQFLIRDFETLPMFEAGPTLRQPYMILSERWTD